MVGEPKSYHFKRSQTLAYAVVQKAACSDLDFRDLSPSVSPRRKAVASIPSDHPLSSG